MSDDLDKLTDDQLSEVFAVEVADLQVGSGEVLTVEPNHRGDPVITDHRPVPSYATSTDATMQWLEMIGEDIAIYRRFERDAPWEISVVLFTEHCRRFTAKSKTLARAVCIVLIMVSRALKS